MRRRPPRPTRTDTLFPYTTLFRSVLAIGLGSLFEKQNIAFRVGLSFSIAASCNFPVLLLSMYWKKLTTRGAMIGGWLGPVSAVGLMVLGPTIWEIGRAHV